MSFTQEQLRAIYAMAMGYGTEAGRMPYKLTVPTDKTGKPIDQSGYTVGVIQFDFGQQGAAKASRFVQMVKTWAASNGDNFGRTDAELVAILTSKGDSLIKFESSPTGQTPTEDQDRKLINAWLAEPGNQSVFFSTFERPLMDGFLFGNSRQVGVSAIQQDSRFDALSVNDQIRILTMLDKVANQGGLGRFQQAYQQVLRLPGSEFNADGIRKALEANFSNLAIDKADNVGQVLARVIASDKLKGLFDAAAGTSTFDTATVGASAQLTFLKVLMRRGQSQPADTKNFIDLIDAGGKADHKVADGAVVGVTSDGQLFAVNSQTLTGFTWGGAAGVGSLILDGKSILQDGKTIIERKTINGKTRFVIAGLEGDEAGFLIDEGGITTLAKAESFAALLAFDLAGADLGEAGSSARQSAADLVRRMVSPILLADAGGDLGSLGIDPLQLAQNSAFAALRDILLNDPQLDIAALGDGQAVAVSGANGTFILTADGQVARALTDDQGAVTGFDFLTGAYAGKTATWSVEGTLTDAQLAALGGSLATAFTAGAQTGAIAMIPLEGFNGTVTASIRDRSTGEVLQSLRVSALLDSDGVRIGTLREETRIENGARITLETRQYLDSQTPALTRVTTVDAGGHSMQTLFANGRFQGITQIDGAAVSAGLNEQFRQTLAANGIEAPTLQDMTRQGQELGDGATAHDTVIRSALAEVKGQAVPGTDYYGNPTLISQSESTLQTISNGVGSLIDALSLIKAIQSGQPLPIVASGLRLAADLDYLDGTRDLPVLGAASSIAGSVLSLYGLANALEQGDGVGAITSAAYAVKGAADAAQFLQTSGLISEVPAGLQTAGNVIGEALPYLNLINSIAHGDETGAAVAVVDLVMMKVVGAYTIPVLGWAYAVYSIIDSLFGDEDEIPDPWGSGQFLWNGHGITYQAAGETGGKEAVENVMASTLAVLNSLIERERQQNPGSQLGIIPNRMPGIGYDMSGYRYTDIDPLTGAEKHPALRFDTSGRPYNAEPGSPESYQSIIEGMVRSALSRGAIAPMWEVETAKAQTDAGDPRAGLSEEERAGRDGQLAPPITGATQTFRPVALDLDGDGIEVTDKANGVAFDVDDTGYLKQTAWVRGDDALLVLDRNYNGQFDSGKELFKVGAGATAANDGQGRMVA